MNIRGTRITGWGVALPDRVVTNADFEARIDTSDQWITERTGIKERRFGGTTASLAAEAGIRAIKSANLIPEDIDLLVLSTTTPDLTTPATSSLVQNLIGTKGGAFDLNAACAGFVYGLVAASGMIKMGSNKVLLIGSDTLSRITDQDDRSTAILFADGAGAIVLEVDSGTDNILAYDLGVDGSAAPILYCNLGDYMKMEGREVFKRAVRVMVDSSNNVLEKANLTNDDIALMVPHQANIRIIEAANQRLGIPIERTAVVLDRTGNTSSASIPLALADAAESGRLKEGDNILFCGFGAGMTWSSAIVKWTIR
jgi:3-oxoacyl-[acyl-carrier-protein] synthase-3